MRGERVQGRSGARSLTGSGRSGPGRSGPRPRGWVLSRAGGRRWRSGRAAGWARPVLLALFGYMAVAWVLVSLAWFDALTSGGDSGNGAPGTWTSGDSPAVGSPQALSVPVPPNLLLPVSTNRTTSVQDSSAQAPAQAGAPGQGASPPAEGASFSSSPSGTVVGTVRNVFGDPVPGATVTLGDLRVRVDPSGRFQIPEVPIGRHLLRVTAPGYQPMSMDLNVEIGTNEPRFKFDTGLRPIGFAADFHVFSGPGNGDTGPVVASVGLANGTDQELLVSGVEIAEPGGQTVFSALTRPEDLPMIAGFLEAVRTTTSPVRALVLPAGVVLHTEMRLAGTWSPAPGGQAAGAQQQEAGPAPQGVNPAAPAAPASPVYRLIITYGTAAELEAGRPHRLVLPAPLTEEPDWDPHLP